MSKQKTHGTAPYQFIDLNENVLLTDQPENKYSIYDPNLNHGFIDVTLTAITELFTRGKNENFKTVNGQPVFQGSSIRGPIRIIAEQMGHAEMKDVEKDEAFFFRTFDSHDGGRLYRDKMQPDRIRGGWLVRENGVFKLYAAKKMLGRDILFMMKKEIKDSVKNQETISFKGFKPYREARKYRPYPDNFSIIRDDDPNKNIEKGILMMSGEMGSKNKEAIIGLKSNQLIAEGEEVLKILKKIENDKNRAQPFSRLSIQKGKPVPCFYVEDRKRQEKAIGFNLFFRYPYRYTVGELIHQGNRIPNLDFVAAIFGDERPENNSNVFFEDFYLTKTTHPEPEQYPHILGGPKASYYPYYLKQVGSNLNTWNDKTTIAGYKNYYHRTEEGVWKKSEFKVDDDFDQRSPVFDENVRALKQHKYVYFLVKFGEGREDKIAEIDRFVAKHNIAYSKAEYEKKKNKKKEYHLQISTEEQLNFVKELGNFKFRLFYVNPPTAALKTKKGFWYTDDSEEDQKESMGSKPIKVLPKGTQFSGRIRFENLTDAQLGLLLLSLDLPEGHAHKIGMGKPLGLGSARFEIQLNLINRSARYTNVFDGNTWNMGIGKPIDTEKIDHFKTAFKQYFEQQIKKKWADQQRIRDLYFLLKTEGTNTKQWTENTRYLELDGRRGKEFKAKLPLKSLNKRASNKATAHIPEIHLKIPDQSAKQAPQQKIAPESIPTYDFNALKQGDSIYGIIKQLKHGKRVEIKLKQGNQLVQLVIPKGMGLRGNTIGDGIPVTVHQISKEKKKIIQVKYNQYR
jgi:CRISPR-associated protein (TIGR03986 family)